MKKRNTKQDMEDIFFSSLMTGDVSRAIVNQEKQGQLELAAAEELPRTGCERAQLEALGFVFLEDDGSDDLFLPVKFPEGWQKKPTEHSMHLDICDNKGRLRGHIFYKAAFYDRSANMSLYRRYTYKEQPITGYGEGYDPNAPSEGVVMDQDQIIWRTEEKVPVRGKWKEAEALREQAKMWLDEHYPDHADVLAYWD